MKTFVRSDFGGTGNLACALKAILIGGNPPETATVS
jgi:hypothetical protein